MYFAIDKQTRTAVMPSLQCGTLKCLKRNNCYSQNVVKSQNVLSATIQVAKCSQVLEIAVEN